MHGPKNFKLNDVTNFSFKYTNNAVTLHVTSGLFVISEFHSTVNQIFALLGCYTT